MEGPGMSLFQGAASIHINNSAQDRLEEQEELEDQKRRDAELQHKLATAFDDLHDDDEGSSVNSSGNFTLDATKTNGKQVLPPYVESVKSAQQHSESPKPFCETPKTHFAQHLRQEAVGKKIYSPYGAGDGPNHYYNQEFTGQVNGINNFEAEQEYMNYEKLKVMYEMRVKEFQQVTAQMEKQDKDIESLRARLVAAINDKDKAEFSLKEAHHLLATSKHKMIEFEQKVNELTQKLYESEEGKEQLRLEIRTSNLNLQEIQQRLHTMQVTHTHDTDSLFREQQERHREEMDRIQSDLIKYKNRLDEKENEIKRLERRCKEREKEKEEIMIEKGGTINRLANELETAQSRLLNGESAKLKEKVAHLTAERNTCQQQVKELGSKLEMTAQELVLCRQKLAAHQKEYENWCNKLNHILLESLPEGAMVAGEPGSPGKLATLKEVLSRYKHQSQKLSTFQDEITKRDKKLEQQRKQESELRQKIEEQKGVEMQLNSRMAMLQNKLDLLSNSSDNELLDTYRQENEKMQNQIDEMNKEIRALELKYAELEMEHEKLKGEKGSRASLVQEANADLLQELDKYGTQLKDTVKENAQLKNLYLQACSQRDAVTRESKEYQTQTQKAKDLYKKQEQEYIERLEKEKREKERLATELGATKEEVERANKRISELQKEFTDKQKEFANKLDKYLQDEKSAMKNEMGPCLQCEKHLKQIRHLDEQLSKCSLKMANQESNEALMKELKGKAEFFQEYIVERCRKLNEQRSVATNTDGDIHVDSDTYDIDVKTDLVMKENAIRDQIAEKFTLEMKTTEMNFTRRIKEVETEHLNAITKLKELLERKVQEVETLKEFILSERGKVTRILESKESEISVLIKEHNELQSQCQTAKELETELKLKIDKYKEKVNRLISVEDALRKERDELKKRTSSKEGESAKSKTSELQVALEQLQRRYDELHARFDTLQEKYKNVKKTMFTYKEYMNKKDLHVNNEMNRIQDEYRKIFVTLQNQMNYLINCRVQEERARGNHHHHHHYQPQEYAEKLKKLNEDFAILAQSTFNDPTTSNKE